MKRKASDAFISRLQVTSSLKEFQRVTPYSKPVELSFFSFDANRQLRLSESTSLACLDKSVKLPLDLNIGYPNDYITRSAEPEGLSALVKSIQRLETTNSNVEFITWRGIMTKIITCPYSLRDDWKLFGIKRGGVVYLFEDEDRQANRFGSDEQQKLFTYYGYKAESLLTKPLEVEKSDESPSNEPAVVNTNIQYCSVFKATLGSHKLIMGAEVDCIENEVVDKSNRMKEYLEIKTHKLIRNPQQDRNFKKFKCLKTWAQSYLAGIPKVLFAFRDEQGSIQKLEKFETSQFPRMARPDNLWDPNVCLTFGSKVLDFIKEALNRDEESLIYSIRYASASQEISISEPFQNKEIYKLSL